MKLKEIERTANVAWSPSSQYPVYLACGTAAQQLDASFSTKSAIEVFRFNTEDESLDCELVAKAETDHRFNKVVWGKMGASDGKHSSGVIVGGTDKGSVCVWDASKLIMQESDSQILTLDKHVGSVGALDFNKHQDNLLASGGSESEILLWDLNNPTTPMTPGAKSQPSDDVTCLSWNCQVQHILASALNTRCVVWDLRKSEPIIKISDSMSRIKSKLVTWHPEIATQLVLASEDDHAPVIQLWDLRFAASPLKVLEKHSRGILSMAWSRNDPDLLISCGKDNRLLCWNPNADVVGGEVTYELPMGNQWCFDVQWCPRNPQCISACSFDGRVSVYSIMGGEMTMQTMAATNKIADSFGGFDNVAPAHSVPKVERTIVPQIAKAPKWLKRPCGASFAFGGKLVSFSSVRSADPSQATKSCVNIQKVVTETDIITHSTQLEHALHNRQFAEFCSLKIANSQSEKEETLWQFLKVNFETDPRSKYLGIMGFDAQEISQKVSSVTGSSNTEDEVTSTMSGLSTTDDITNGSMSAGDAFDQISQSSALVKAEELKFNTSEGPDSLLTQALLTGNFGQAVDLCLHDGRMADAIILANADGPALLERTMKRYFKQCSGSTSALISAVVQKDYRTVIENTALENWKEALAVILTYGKPGEFVQLCDKLGSRLEASDDTGLSSNAVLCYICSGNIEKFAECWVRQTPDNGTSMALQDLIEKVMMLRRAVEQLHGQEYAIPAGSSLANKLGQYAELLATEGSLQTALGYLAGTSQSQKLSTLKFRLQTALGQQGAVSPWPKSQEVRAPTQQPANKMAGRTSRQASNPYAQPGTQPAYLGTNPYQTNNVPASTANPYQSNTGYGVSQPRSTAQPTAGTSYYNGNVNAGNSTVHSAYNGTAATTTTPSTYGSYGAPAQPTSAYNPGQQPYATPYTAGPTQQPYNQTPSQQQPGTGYPAPGYGSSGGYGGYGQPAPSAGHVAARGLLSKKYASTPASSQPESTPSNTTPAPQSYYNPAAQPNTSLATTVAGGMGGQNSYNTSATSNVYNPSSAYPTTSSTPADDRGPAVTRMRRLSHHMTQDGLQAGGYGTPYQPPTPAAPAGPAIPIPTVDAARVAPAGWNDPPPVHSKEPETSSASAKAAPITMPVYNPAAPQIPQQQMYGQQPQQYGQQAGYNYQTNQQQPAQQYSPQQQQGSSAAQMSPQAKPAPVEVVKAPIPEKDAVLKETLDTLVQKCLHASNNPQQKRKLEDVLKKLEYLYDKLRNQMLNPSILTGIHQIVSAIKQYDYQSGLAVHSHLVSQGNFSEISAFMPGLKMLMQTALQLQVFV